MINKYWRILATGSSFLLFAFGGVVLSLLIFPVLKLVHRKDENHRRVVARRVVHKTFKMFVGYMQLLGIMKLEVDNSELLNGVSGNVVIANHPSLIDVVVLISIIENANCVVKSDLWKNPFLNSVFRNTGYINNESDPDKFVQDCKESFNDGNNLIVFPEGTRTKPGEEIKFKRGAANIALRTQSNVTPILLYVTPTTLSKGLAWYQIPKTRFVFRLIVKSEISVQKYIAVDAISNSVRELTRDLIKYYNEELSINERVN